MKLRIKGKEAGSKWRFAVDRGGTFTDVIGLDPEGKYHILKLLSSSPGYENASIEGIRRILGLEAGQLLLAKNIEAIRFGTTIATNALLERKGGRVALFITKGFADLLEIGEQNRPDIFSLSIKKPSLLYSMVVEVEERIDRDGKIIGKLEIERLREQIRFIRLTGVDSVAMVLMNSWKNPAHEILCEKIIREEGMNEIVLSHKSVNLIKILSRGQSTVLNAYLGPVIESYLEKIENAAKDIPVMFMKSSGGLSYPHYFKGKDAILSGPAGGVVAVADIANDGSLKGVIGFDMGGTSTDVSRYDGEFEKVYEREISGVRLYTEMLNINTVASGGGSILWFDGNKMRVGPESAGAFPGPACYGFEGPLTITDANLLTGRIVADHFPKTFGKDGSSSIDPEIVKKKFHDLTKEINGSMKGDLSPQDVASGFLRIANEKMAMAIKEISVSRGFDVREYALVCFGGAGGQHACDVASLLEMDTIIFHQLTSVMSAYGIGLSRPSSKVARTVLLDHDKGTHKELLEMFDDMFSELADVMNENIMVYKKIDLRIKGAHSFITVNYDGYKESIEAFKQRHEKIFGFVPADMSLEVVNIRIEVQDEGEFFPEFIENNRKKNEIPSLLLHQWVQFSGGPVDTPLFERESLPASGKLSGPGIVIDPHSTLIINPDFEADLKEDGMIVLKRTAKERKTDTVQGGNPDPVLLEVFNNLFMGISTEMGYVLQNTAHSVNIKERLDFSCAVFDAEGNLVANAPHIPVHLGSMADTVRAVLSDKGDIMQPGDAYVSNNPYRGGSHLPDITVVCPLFSDDKEIMFFTAARGHHADIGGSTPGSFPPDAEHIDDEGVLIDGELLLRDGEFMEEDIRWFFSMHKHGVRNEDERIADLKAQVASCHKGVDELKKVIERFGLDTVQAYMGYIQDNAEFSVKKALQKFLGGGKEFNGSFEDKLDDDTSIKVSIMIDGGANPPETVKAVIDFTGTGPQHDKDNLNAPLSVTRSAVLYVLRTINESEIPLNSGCLNPVEIVVPEGTILNPEYPLPVAAGNVETSQRVVDVLLGALGVAAASQGTMNNFLFEVKGDTPYYETIAGGAGATATADGASGVQVHMTNTRITDPEILEVRHPHILVKQFRIRRGSGGGGARKGGDGITREIKFLKPATATIISERRKYSPYGLNGGKDGRKGENIRVNAKGETEVLPNRTVVDVKKGESIIIHTPGGGGFG
ncbi:MAG: hydantoinase B/oxoprolinase family protein, partial [Thermodesulfovibrionales bacterium]